MKNAILTLLLLVYFTNIFAQDSIKVKNVLVIESTKEKKWGPSVAPKVFRTGTRVYVENRNDSTWAKGKIQLITDSSIRVKDIEFKLKDISRINNYRRGITAIVGATTLLGGIISEIAISNYYNVHTYEYDGTEGSASTGPQLIGALIIFAGAVTTLVGVIEVGATKHYKMNGKWKFDVKPDIFQSVSSRKAPNPFPFRKKQKSQ